MLEFIQRAWLHSSLNEMSFRLSVTNGALDKCRQTPSEPLRTFELGSVDLCIDDRALAAHSLAEDQSRRR